MDEGSRASLPARWASVADRLPAALGELTGPPEGVVELPFDLAWSGRTSFDLADPVQRYLYHMTILTAAITPDHYTRWLNADLLRADWARLGIPRSLRSVWQSRFPELADPDGGHV